MNLCLHYLSNCGDLLGWVVKSSPLGVSQGFFSKTSNKNIHYSVPKQATLISVFLRNITLSRRTNAQDFKVEYRPQDTMKKVLKTTYLNEEIEPFQLKRLKQGLEPSRAPQREPRRDTGWVTSAERKRCLLGLKSWITWLADCCSY